MTTTDPLARLPRRGRDRAPRSASGPVVLELVDRSREALLGACHSADATQRYQLAQLGALRAGAALVASRPAHGRSGRRDLWPVVSAAAPELAEWAQFFSAAGERASSGVRGRTHLCTREADDLVRQAEMFLELVLARLGLPMQPPLSGCVAPIQRP